MKKLISFLLVSAFCLAGIFSLDLASFPSGTWEDRNWNADWVFSVDKIELKDSTTGELIFDFGGKMENFKILPSTEGITLSFDCAETERSYKFTKSSLSNTNIVMEIDPNWTDEVYKIELPFKN